MHLPSWVDEEYVAQLTSEVAVRRYVRGRGTVREYVKTRERNEALDLEVYSLAALYMLGEHARKKLAEKAAALTAANPPIVGEEAERRAKAVDDENDLLPNTRAPRRPPWRRPRLPSHLGRGWAAAWRD